MTYHATTKKWYIEDPYLILRTYEHIEKWEGCKREASKSILQAILRRNFKHNALTQEEKYKCKLLVGPNGYAIFKMLCIKYDLELSTDVHNNATDS